MTVLRSKSWTSRSLVDEAERGLRVVVVADSSTGGTVDQGTAGVDPWIVTGSVSVSNWPATQPVSAVSLPLPTGASTAARQDTGNASLSSIDTKLTSPLTVTGPLTDAELRAVAVPVSGTFWQATQPVSIAATVAVSGPLTDAQLRAVAVPVSGTFWQATQPVSIAATVATQETRSATGTQTSVAGSASSVTLLASNANRLGATIYNDSTAILYVRLQATASTTDFSVKLFPDDFYEVPFGYTGIIDGIWASATGSARVTEMT